MNSIVSFILRRSRWVILSAVAISIPAAYFTARLYGNLKPDLEELLPRQSRSILDLDEIRARLKSVQRLGILVYSDDVKSSRRFVDDLARKLESFPKSKIASVEYRINRELKFFGDRKALFLESQDLMEIRDYIWRRIEYEKQLYNPLNIFSGLELQEPHFDFDRIRLKYETRAGSYDRFPDGYYATKDEKKRLIWVNVPGELSGITGIHEFKKTVAEAVDGLNPKSYAPDLHINYTGGAQDIIEEYSSLVNDIEVSAEVVFTVVVAALILFFRSWLATGALLLALFMARFWTFGLSWFTVGSLNANSAFMGSIVLGSGITFGVMLLSRYLEERRLGRVPLRAARIAMFGTARATWTAALAAGFAYGSLYFTEFEGFKQYGIMGFQGMVLCWISSVCLLPALLVEIERWKPMVKSGSHKARPSWIFGPLTRLLQNHPGKVLVASIVVTALSVLSFAKFDSEAIIEKNLAKLRNRESMTKGSGYFYKDVDDIMGASGAPVIVLAHSTETALEISRKLKQEMIDDGDKSLISSVNDITTFIPQGQPEKMRLLHDVDRILPQRYRRELAPADRSKVEELLRPSLLKPISEENLPVLVKEKFTEKDGAVGRLVLVDSRVDSTDWSAPQLNAFVSTIRDIADKVEGRKVPVAGTLTVSSDMIASIMRDGPKASILSFVAVVILIVVLFRKPKIAALMLSALVLGTIWMFGVVLATGMKINFLNFIALPITFGIGVDYGVNIFDRYLHDPEQDILRVVRETGGAVGLCSFTTIVGYSSLMLAQNQAFVSFGALAVLGEITSVVAAVVSLPALLLYLRKRPIQPKVEIAKTRPAAPKDDQPAVSESGEACI